VRVYIRELDLGTHEKVMPLDEIEIFLFDFKELHEVLWH
jgi:hypothetical protein